MTMLTDDYGLTKDTVAYRLPSSELPVIIDFYLKPRVITFTKFNVLFYDFVSVIMPFFLFFVTV